MREQRDAFHLAIPARDLDEAQAFYVAGLGCKLARRYDDWRAVQELTAVCRGLDPEDPARYDFALFGLGAYKGEGLGTKD